MTEPSNNTYTLTQIIPTNDHFCLEASCLFFLYVPKLSLVDGSRRLFPVEEGSVTLDAFAQLGHDSGDTGNTTVILLDLISTTFEHVSGAGLVYDGSEKGRTSLGKSFSALAKIGVDPVPCDFLALVVGGSDSSDGIEEVLGLELIGQSPVESSLLVCSVLDITESGVDAELVGL